MIQINSQRKYAFICLLINIAEFLVDSFSTIYLLEKGASYEQIGIMWTLYLGTTALTDYPTGGFADKYGRRNIYSLGILLTSLSYFLILSNYIPIMYISYVIKGVGTSFISGSLIAWLSCDLKDASEFKSTLSHTKLITNISSFILPMVTIMFVDINVSHIFILSAVLHLFVGIFALIFLEENYGSRKEISTIYKDVIKYYFKEKGLLFITSVNITLYLFFTIFYFSWQPITKMIIDNNRYVPIFYGIYTLSSGISSYLMKYISKKAWKQMLFIVMISYCLCFLSFYIANDISSLTFLIIAMILFGLSGGIVFMLSNLYINQHSPSKYKSSIYSLISSICTITNVVFQYIFGKVIDIYGLMSLLIFSIIISILIILGLFFVRNTKNITVN